MTFIPNKDFFLEVRKGNVSKHSSFQVLGFNGTVGTSFEHVWAYSVSDLVFQTAVSIYDIYSSNINDTKLGTGVRTILVEGLSDSGALLSETINTNGTTAVSTVNQYFRLNKITCVDNGTYGGSNLGTITAELTGGGNIQAFMSIGAGVSQKSHYTVPLGYTAYITSTHITVDSNKSTTIELLKREDALTTSAPFTSTIATERWDGITENDFEPVLTNHIFPALTDIWFEAKVNTGTAVVQTDYEVILIQD